MPKKVLYTASTYSHLKNFHLPYLKLFKKHGYNVTVLAGGEKKEIPFADYLVDMPFKKKMASPSNFLLVFRIARLIKKERFDIISTHTALAAFFTRLAVILAGKENTTVINTSHGYLFDSHANPLKKTVLLLAEKMTAPVTDIVFTMNRQDTEIAKRHHLATKNICQIDGMGVDIGKFRKTAPGDSLRGQWGIQEDDFVLIYAAEFSKRKSQQMLINAMNDLPVKIKLLLPGDGELFQSCRELARKSGLSNRIIFPGYIADMPAYYQASNVCVSASRIEGLPFNIMEGMASGLPVVASRIKGHEDLISDGENGYLFECNRANEFCAQIMKLYLDPDLSLRIGLHNSVSVQKYSLESVLPETARLLKPYM